MPTQWTDDPLDPYRREHAQRGSGFSVTLWNTPESQQKRFRVLKEMVYLQGKHLLDAGCSRGDLAAWLIEHDTPYARYTGIDGLPEVIEFAKSRDLPHADFIAANLLEQPQTLRDANAQIIFLSGTLNTMDINTAMGLLETCWEAARETLVFNFLSDLAGPGAPPQDYPAIRLPALELIDWAARRAEGNIALRQDYFRQGHDATIVMRKS